MLHLLTDEHRKKVVTEYRKRVTITLLVGLLVVCLVSFVFILPTYFVSHNRYSDVFIQNKTLDSELAVKEENGSSENIKNVTLSIEALKIFEESKNPSGILSSIIRSKPSGVRIKNIIFTPGNGPELTVDMAGSADTRKSLVQFDQALKNRPIFDEVVIPLSNFAKEKNIDFSVKLIVSTSTNIVEDISIHNSLKTDTIISSSPTASSSKNTSDEK